MHKRNVLLLVVAALAITLAGCLGTGIVVSLTPDPLVLAPGDTHVDAQVKVKLTGFGTIRVDTVRVVALDANGDEIINQDTGDPYEVVVEVNRNIVVVPGIAITEPVEIPISYDQAQDKGLRTIRVIVTGSHPDVIDIEIQLVGGV